MHMVGGNPIFIALFLLPLCIKITNEKESEEVTKQYFYRSASKHRFPYLAFSTGRMQFNDLDWYAWGEWKLPDGLGSFSFMFFNRSLKGGIHKHRSSLRGAVEMHG